MNKVGGWTAALILAAIVLIGLASQNEKVRFVLALGGWSFTRSVAVKSPGDERATYYRLLVNLAYKGEPLNFDIVVGCHVRITTYKDNDRTVETGVAPMAFGLKMKDGHAVVVRPPEACRGETTENGQVPKTLLPFVVTYENADEPWFGLAYASEDAYDSPLSELKFLGASISNATREEWQVWRRTEAPKNFVTYALLGLNPRNMWDFPKWTPGYRVMASSCLAASWVKIPEAIRDVVRPFWPSDKPVYWYPNEETRQALWHSAYDPKNPPLFEGNRFRDYLEKSLEAEGLARRQPGAEISYKHRVVGDLYPIRANLSLNELDAKVVSGDKPAISSQSRRIDAEVSPERRGFAYCDDTIFPFAGVPGGQITNQELLLNKINGAPISEALWPAGRGSNIIFERDERLILPRRYELGNVFGGL